MARMKFWLMGVIACLVLAAGITPAQAQVVVVRRGPYHHRYHRYYHHRHYYHHGHGYYR